MIKYDHLPRRKGLDLLLIIDMALEERICLFA